MVETFLSGRVALWPGDMLEILRGFEANSIDSVVTDPPYNLSTISKRYRKTAPDREGTNERAARERSQPYARTVGGFMGKAWDSDVAFQPETWAEVWRVLKPGGHVLAFGGTRTYHRLACAIEDAGYWEGEEWIELGFEIRDQIGWLFGSGFPKSHDVAKGIDAKLTRGGARTEDIRRMEMGDGYEPSGRGRMNYDNGHGSQMGGRQIPRGKPVRRIRPGADQHSSGSWEKLDDRTYQPHEYIPATDEARQWQGWGTALKPAWEPIVVARKPLDGTVAENVLRHGTGAINIDGCRVPGEPWTAHDASGLASVKFFTNGDTPVVHKEPHDLGRWPANLILSVPEDEYELRSSVTPEQKRELYRWFSENA